MSRVNGNILIFVQNSIFDVLAFQIYSLFFSALFYFQSCYLSVYIYHNCKSSSYIITNICIRRFGRYLIRMSRS